MSQDTISPPPSDEARRERRRIIEYLKYHEECARQRSTRRPREKSDNVHAFTSGILVGIIDALERDMGHDPAPAAGQEEE